MFNRCKALVHFHAPLFNLKTGWNMFAKCSELDIVSLQEIATTLGSGGNSLGLYGKYDISNDCVKAALNCITNDKQWGNVTYNGTKYTYTKIEKEDNPIFDVDEQNPYGWGNWYINTYQARNYRVLAMMDNCFLGTSVETGPIVRISDRFVGKIDTDVLTDTTEMFSGKGEHNTDILNWCGKLNNVVKSDYMFAYCPIENFCSYMPKVTSVSGMFYHAF